MFDIIFRDGCPSAGVPGGSVFNSLVSLGRMNVPVQFISEIGDDPVADLTLEFMQANRMSTQYVCRCHGRRSPIALAFLDAHNDASYTFYKDYPTNRLDIDFPTLEEDDIVLLGSYYVIDPTLRHKVVELLEEARRKRAIVYYDPNFRAAHRDEAVKLTPSILENLEYADIVRGSADDFANMYQMEDADRIYRDKIAFYCPRFIYTAGGKEVRLYTRQHRQVYEVPQLSPVSTIGAGDNFNAGILFGLLRQRIRHCDLDNLSPSDWDAVIRCGLDFSAEVCMSMHNYISTEFAERYK